MDERGNRGEERHLAALPRHRLERPAMILAGDLPAIEPSVGKRNAAVRTGIAHGEVTARGGPSPDQWDAQQHGRRHVLAGYFRGGQCGIPVVIQQRGGRPGCCGLRARDFASHGPEFHTIAECWRCTSQTVARFSRADVLYASCRRKALPLGSVTSQSTRRHRYTVLRITDMRPLPLQTEAYSWVLRSAH